MQEYFQLPKVHFPFSHELCAQTWTCQTIPECLRLQRLDRGVQLLVALCVMGTCGWLGGSSPGQHSDRARDVCCS